MCYANAIWKNSSAEKMAMPTTCTLLKRPPQSTFEAASWLSFDEFCLALMFILDKTH